MLGLSHRVRNRALKGLEIDYVKLKLDLSSMIIKSGLDRAPQGKSPMQRCPAWLKPTAGKNIFSMFYKKSKIRGGDMSAPRAKYGNAPKCVFKNTSKKRPYK